MKLCVIWPHAGRIGIFMTRNFVCCANLTLLNFRWGRRIGNSGSAHKTLIMHTFPSANAQQFVSWRTLSSQGFCHIFHWGMDCSGYNFKHQCFKCGVVHPALRCNFRPQQSTPRTAPTAAKLCPTNPGSNWIIAPIIMWIWFGIDFKFVFWL